MSNVITLDESIKWTIGGQDYQIKKPSVKMISFFHEKHKLAGDDIDAKLEATLELLQVQGLPKDIGERLNSDQLALVVESIVAPKKKA